MRMSFSTGLLSGAPLTCGEARARLAARRVSVLGACIVAAPWLGAALAAGIALPYNYPYQVDTEIVDTAVLIALLGPCLIAAQLLSEGLDGAVRTASRNLRKERGVAALVYLSQAIAGAWLVTVLGPVPGLRKGRSMGL